jgi:murein DD-endopeptidase MepM/ murein hydrolase activator NlpD
MTFWIAVLSLFAFVTGNMVGSLGWQVFWKAVLGGTDDSLIVYDGAVTPVRQVPNFEKWWSRYGGDAQKHTYREVPRDLLLPLPKYAESKNGAASLSSVFSIDYLGTYDDKGGQGCHVGIDIRVPEGTPVYSVMNGIVTQAREDAGGFGYFVVIRHPNVPDPKHPTKKTTLYSIYAHLSQTLVREGEVVHKGDQIALSGMTGFATGPHLHFQIDRDEAPWHPYWPFTSAEARQAGLTLTQAINQGLHRERAVLYTINPMLYVQANYAPVGTAVVKAGGDAAGSVAVKKTPAQLREERLAKRKQRVAEATATKPIEIVAIATEAPVGAGAVATTSSSTASVSSAPVQELAPAPSPQPSGIVGIEVIHDGSFSRGWETVRIRLLDDHANASTATLPGDLYLQTAYGNAEFNPAILSPLDFENGVATVQVLPRSQQTLVIKLQPKGNWMQPILSPPMIFER